MICPKCNSVNVKYNGGEGGESQDNTFYCSYYDDHYTCLDCGHSWTDRAVYKEKLPEVKWEGAFQK